MQSESFPVFQAVSGHSVFLLYSSSYKKIPTSCLSKKFLPNLLDLGCVGLLIIMCKKLTQAQPICPRKKKFYPKFCSYICYGISNLKKMKFNINFIPRYKVLHFHTSALVSLI